MKNQLNILTSGRIYTPAEIIALAAKYTPPVRNDAPAPFANLDMRGMGHRHDRDRGAI